MFLILDNFILHLNPYLVKLKLILFYLFSFKFIVIVLDNTFYLASEEVDLLLPLLSITRIIEITGKMFVYPPDQEIDVLKLNLVGIFRETKSSLILQYDEFFLPLEERFYFQQIFINNLPILEGYSPQKPYLFSIIGQFSYPLEILLPVYSVLRF